MFDFNIPDLTDEQNNYRIEFENTFAAQYVLNDRAHRVEHFREVLDTGLVIAERVGFNLNEGEQLALVAAAYLHDLFAWSRPNHHLLSKEFVMGSEHPMLQRLTDIDINLPALVANACDEHRASYKGVFSSKFSELVNSSDRGLPTNPKVLLERAIQYRTAYSSSESRDVIIAESKKHIFDKFGTKGYARYPDMYRDAFGTELDIQQRYVDYLFSY